MLATPLSMCILGIELGSPGSNDKDFTSQVIFSAINLFYRQLTR